MRKSLPLLLVVALIVSGCGFSQSRFNPLNWFGGGRNRELSASETNPLIPRRSSFARPEEVDNRPPVARVAGVVAEPHPGGAILRVTGVSSRQGAYQAGLRQIEDETVPDSVLRFVLVARQPAGAVGTEPTRTLTVGRHLTDDALAGIRTIEVLGAQNAITIRR
ncbi:hypothetical protein ACRARG_00230 [Pseudooceanicola sp. C21-150M6]|uniref:hypothetical protein n=1 Tax=Pseudooceanicola sp. C21-150M6 TaxID=3434355 RepID=UPI003D7FF206